jgi:hypothetical protein
VPDIFLRPVTRTDAVFLYDFGPDTAVIANPPFPNFTGLGGFDFRRLKPSHALKAHHAERPTARPCRPNGDRLARLLEERQLRCQWQLNDEDELLLLDFFD